MERLLDWFRGPQLTWSLLWLGLVMITCALLALMVTRWGQSRPLRKCVVLSLLTHLLLATYATTVQIVASAPGRLEEPSLRITSVGEGDSPRRRPEARGSAEPWEEFPLDSTPDTPAAALDRPGEGPIEPERLAAEDPSVLASQVPAASLDPSHTGPRPQPIEPAHDRDEPFESPAEPIDAPQAAKQEAVDPVSDQHHLPRPAGLEPDLEPRPDAGADEPVRSQLAQPGGTAHLDDPPTSPDPQSAIAGFQDFSRRVASPLDAESLEPHTGARAGAQRTSDPATGPAARQPASSGTAADRAADATGKAPRLDPIEALPLGKMPEAYQLRRTPGRAVLTEQRGGSQATEASVNAALEWLADHQEPGGRWDASRFGAGRGRDAPTTHRHGAGAESDTGVTGLALLAFLGAGHTHAQGDHRQTVARGLEFLLASQAADGNLAGKAELYAFMYCHGMAAFALSEAYGMTLDERLLDPVRRAMGYTLRAQNRSTGGWRYRPGDTGDTSQLGWQLMALKSGELAGIQIPSQSKDGMVRFLSSVASGRRGGLSSYRPGEKVSRAMTAEALVCRQLLGMARANPAGDEAGDFLLEEPPGTGQPNLYYWYYATLGMYQLQGEHWTRWNDALVSTLVEAQRVEGDLAGSWDPDHDVWGGHGGRVYTTALGALCLEVYYRFLPLYAEAASREAARPK